MTEKSDGWGRAAAALLGSLVGRKNRKRIVWKKKMQFS